MKKLWLLAGLAGGYFGARRLLDRELPESTPEALRAPLERTQAALRRGRDHAREAIVAGREEQAKAERELHAEYLRKAGRRAR